MFVLLIHPPICVCVCVCSPAACPVLCSGNGQYSRGRCQCYSGWKGTECDVPANQCIDIHCGGHGICIMGACICNTGYKGDNCEEGESDLHPRSHIEGMKWEMVSLLCLVVAWGSWRVESLNYLLDWLVFLSCEMPVKCSSVDPCFTKAKMNLFYTILFCPHFKD